MSQDDIEPKMTESQSGEDGSGQRPNLPEAGSRNAGQPAAEESQGGEQVELQTLRAELEQVTDLARRSQADLENYRKRMAREMEQERRYANLPLLRDLLPVMDNLERAVAAAGSAGETGGLAQGVSMVIEQFRGVLARHGCQRIEAVGQAFDPHLHQAILQQPTADHPPGTVVFEAAPGYILHDRVIRHSQVIVAATPPEA